MDFATLGIRMDDSGAVRTIGSLDRLTAAGSRTEQALQRQTAAARNLGQQYERLSDSDIANASARFDQMFGATTRVTDSTRKMTMMQMEAIKMNEAMGASTVTASNSLGRFTMLTGNSRMGLGRLSTAFAALTARLAGVSPILGTVAASLGSFAAGSALTAGVLAGLALLIMAWRHFTSESREARAEADELVKKLLEMDKARRPAELYATEMEKLKNRLREAKEEAADSFTVFGRLSMILLAMSSGTFWKKGPQAWLDELRKMPGQIETAIGERGLQEQERLAEIARDAAKVAADAAKSARALVFANEERVRLAQQELDTIGKEGLALEEMRIAQEAINEVLRVRETLRDKELEDAITSIEGARDMKIAGARERERLRVIEKEEEYAKDMQAIWREGIGRIVTDGTKSFADFFENVLRMFSKLMARMEAEGKNKGGMYKALGVGSIAISGAFAGYEIGQSTTSRARGAGLGAASGAMSGAAMGSVIPGIGTAAGAAIGGLTGFIGGLLGSGKAAREAAKELAVLRKSLALSVDALRARDRGDSLAIEIANAQAEFEKIREDIRKAFAPGTQDSHTRDARLAEVNALEARRIELLKQEAAVLRKQYSEDLGVRLLRAQGKDKEADKLAMQYAQDRERADLIKSFGSEIDAIEASTLALLDRVHVEEKLKAAMDASSKSALNMVSGYKLQDVIFDAMVGRERPAQQLARVRAADTKPSIPLDVSIEMTGDVVLADGTVLGNVVLKGLQKKASARYGDSTRWSEVQ